MIDSPSVDLVATVMPRLDVWWAVAGGWAIDLWLDEQTREHHDVEVAVRRDDQTQIWKALHDDWELLCLDPPGSEWRQWHYSTRIVPPAFQLKARAPSFEFDIFLESTADDMWVFRRDDRVQKSFDELIATSSGTPILRPEVQLLYMAKSEEPKNEHDFTVASPSLDDASRDWLRRALTIVDPRHRWLPRLSSA
jgi:hypothetical protein